MEISALASEHLLKPNFYRVPGFWVSCMNNRALGVFGPRPSTPSSGPNAPALGLGWPLPWPWGEPLTNRHLTIIHSIICFYIVSLCAQLYQNQLTINCVFSMVSTACKHFSMLYRTLALITKEFLLRFLLNVWIGFGGFARLRVPSCCRRVPHVLVDGDGRWAGRFLGEGRAN